MIHHITGEMDPAWESIPLFVDRYGDFSFFITLPSTPLDPPEFDPPLGPKDMAMIETLEDNLDAMNQQVAASSAAARNAPPPPPSDPDAAKFWRIHCDWSIDTDQDGTPDWMEFEIGTWTSGGPTLPLQADAFHGDTNNNGIPDGEELDFDNDGVPDARDVGKDDSSATYEIGPTPRYALFPITNATPPAEWPSPVQINDMGTVLYSNGTWTGGVWTPLQGAANRGDIGVVVQAFAINDNDEIVGHHTGMLDANGNPIPSHSIAGNLAYWSAPNVTCVPLGVGTDYPWIGGVQHSYPGPYQGNYLSNDGHLIGQRETLASSPETGTTIERPGDRWIWTLPGLGRTPGKIPVSFDEGGVLDSSLYWGFASNAGEDPQQTIISGAGQINSPGTIHNLNRGPLGELIASFKYDKYTQVWKNGGWHGSLKFSQAIDISEDGTAIGKAHDGLNAPILLNGEWTGIKRFTGLVADIWANDTVSLLDTTPRGWILAERGYPFSTDKSYGVMLPIRLQGSYQTVKVDKEGVETPLTLTKGVGVDDFSIGSNDPGAMLEDKIWIMAPMNDVMEVTLSAPINTSTQLKLSTLGNLLEFGSANEITLSSPESTFTVTAATGPTQPVSSYIDVQMGSEASLSRPLASKNMPNRTVNVTVFQIARKLDNGTWESPAPGLLPSQAQLENHLDNLFKPQLNLDIQLTMDPTVHEVDWDLGGNLRNGRLDNNPDPTNHSEEQKTIIDFTENSAPTNIKVFIVAGGQMLSSDGDAYGMTCREMRTCWVLGSRVAGYRVVEDILETIGHEIGHVLVGYGHPNSTDKSKQGPAPLPGTLYAERLMRKGLRSTIEPRVLVKAEWDAADIWLRDNLDEQ